MYNAKINLEVFLPLLLYLREYYYFSFPPNIYAIFLLLVIHLLFFINSNVVYLTVLPSSDFGLVGAGNWAPIRRGFTYGKIF